LELEKRLHPDDPSIREALERLDAIEAAMQAELEPRRADLRAEAHRRKLIIDENFKRMGWPKHITPDLVPELYWGLEHVSPMDLMMSPAEGFYLRDDSVNDEETELC
jgi:hypothetical protein